jgi:DNA-binding MarR family transcriptional regulator
MTDALGLPQPGLAFLLSTLGYHSHALWAERLVRLRLDTRQAAMLLHVAAAEGKPQQVLVRALRIPASRVVALVDDLEQRRLLQRRGDPADRRVRRLHLTPQGKRVVGQLAERSAAHEAQLCAGLEPGEREQLLLLLRKAASGLQLSPNVHSGLGGDDAPWPAVGAPIVARRQTAAKLAREGAF